MMTLRAYNAPDRQAVIDLWNICLPEDAIDEENFFKRIICDIHFDPDLFYLAEENGVIKGFSYGTVMGDKAYIIAMGVHPDYRKKGFGNGLLDALEKSFAEKGAVSVDIGC
jgi:ribosomal protein S18 acetylase RimI-like enzyme